MKLNIIKILPLSMIALGALVLPSCKKYLDTDLLSSMSTDAVFSSVTNTQSAINGVYNQLTGDQAYGIRLSLYFAQSADDFKTSGSKDGGRRDFSMFCVNPANTELANPFNNLFAGIERANICIKYIPKSDLYTKGNATQQTSMKKMYGEALTLRSMFILEVLRNWGDAPVSLIPSSDVTNLYIPNISRDSLYDHVLNDLKTAEDLVPWRSETGDPATKISKAVVKAMRARIALYRGGFSLRGDSKQMERRSDYKTYYQIAMDECKDIIQKNENGLNASYENLFKSLHTSSNSYVADNANEMMWVVGASTAGGLANTDTKLGYYNGIKSASTTYGTGGGGITAIPTYFYEFDSIGDARRDVTLAYIQIDNKDQKTLQAADAMADGKFRRNWTNNSTAQYMEIQWPLVRFADVLLMYAEADNEINGAPSSAAQNALKRVRDRAYAGYLDREPAMPTSHDGFFNALVQERLLEFGGEGIRKYDLIRWNLIGTKINETRAKLTQFADTTGTGAGRYSNVPMVIYAKTNAFLNAAIPQEMSSLILATDAVGGTGPVAKVYFTPSPVTTAPTGYTAYNWRKQIKVATYLNDANQGYAYYFKSNFSELLPFPNTAINTNFNLVQNPYYGQ
ncbi:RagB/SusD family nutrient uptake outer membrane protein [Pinibacter soli]|uniref:RagB/SusD family nutrient uptake outer membrane protein n=1 Tax=Pinibacter soli TaxID=3044211 RepID=A0ABT6REX6_9BACT|nr:RagB/SusD family nutrient uptake outer membrane protein [Pinibacter soli]MDI3321124.1 RagB/SusD family nutrient uptake outer membrane protein [Pinibacter soli]